MKTTISLNLRFNWQHFWKMTVIWKFIISKYYRVKIFYKISLFLTCRLQKRSVETHHGNEKKQAICSYTALSLLVRRATSRSDLQPWASAEGAVVPLNFHTGYW